MKIRIDVNVPGWTKWLVSGIGIGVVLGVGGARVYADTVDVKTDWQPGDTLTADDLNANFAALKVAVDELKHPTCPEDYARDTTASGIVLCKKGADEVVRVGTGGSTFWIDRYEASIWTTPDGQTGTQVGDGANDLTTAGVPRNGQAAPGSAYALSIAGVTPKRNVTWFQAVAACTASGKRLPDGQDWLRAAQGTPDGSGCNINGTSPLSTGQGTSCASAWGAQDMVGNLWELTAEWYVGAGSANTPAAAWPDATGYNDDGTWNIASSAYAANGDAAGTVGLPAAAMRGGSWTADALPGVFTLNLSYAPSFWGSTIGFRCVLPH
jgi:hypothetical protein